MHRNHSQKTGDFIQTQQRKHCTPDSDTVHFILSHIIHQHNRQNSHCTVICLQQRGHCTGCCKTDYSAMGILTIVLMYNMRKNKMYCIGIGCAVLTLLSLNEITCFLAMIPVHFYNGKRGLNLKYPVLCVFMQDCRSGWCLFAEICGLSGMGGGLRLCTELGNQKFIVSKYRSFHHSIRLPLTTAFMS